jgi:diguanylate cyclase (GGDEF)-like protein
VIGTLWMWGDMLEEAALPAATIFASQVAVALENARLYNEIQQLAITDELTALYNRRGILELGQREVDRALRYNRPLTAVMLDIDHFKLVNDRYGHPLGDEVLCWLAEICRRNVREIDIVGRYGGEEFLILLPESEMRNSTQLAERLRQRVGEAKIPTRVGDLSITISLGLSELTDNTRDLKTLIAHSDQALYAAKRAGRNRVITY